MTTVAEKPAGSRVMMAEPGSWLVLLGGLAEQAARVAGADRGRAALLAAVSHDLRAPLAAAKARGWRRTCWRRGLAGAARILRDRVREALGPQPQPVLADIPSGLPEVITDPAIAERVIVNLTGNALRYSPAAVPLLLTARTAGNRVELRVVDHGPGIAAADRKRVFQPFCRLGDPGDRTGVGLGLAVARGLAETMGGAVEPEDTPGGGLTMVLTLPAAPARPAAEAHGTRRIRAA